MLYIDVIIVNLTDAFSAVAPKLWVMIHQLVASRFLVSSEGPTLTSGCHFYHCPRLCSAVFNPLQVLLCHVFIAPKVWGPGLGTGCWSWELQTSTDIRLSRNYYCHKSLILSDLQFIKECDLFYISSVEHHWHALFQQEFWQWEQQLVVNFRPCASHNIWVMIDGCAKNWVTALKHWEAQIYTHTHIIFNSYCPSAVYEWLQKWKIKAAIYLRLPGSKSYWAQY